MLAQLLEVLVGGAVGDCARGGGEAERGALGVGEERGALKLPDGFDFGEFDAGERVGEVAGVRLAVGAAGAARDDMRDQLLEAGGDVAFAHDRAEEALEFL